MTISLAMSVKMGTLATMSCCSRELVLAFGKTFVLLVWPFTALPCLADTLVAVGDGRVLFEWKARPSLDWGWAAQYKYANCFCRRGLFQINWPHLKQTFYLHWLHLLSDGIHFRNSLKIYGKIPRYRTITANKYNTRIMMWLHWGTGW